MTKTAFEQINENTLETMTLAQIDGATGSILGVAVGRSSNKTKAIARYQSTFAAWAAKLAAERAVENDQESAASSHPRCDRKVYTFKPIEIPTSWCPQAKVLAFSLMDCGVADGETVRTNIEALVAEGRLKTKQDPWRIFQYYQAGFTKAGMLTITTDDRVLAVGA